MTSFALLILHRPPPPRLVELRCALCGRPFLVPRAIKIALTGSPIFCDRCAADYRQPRLAVGS